ncbi:MAG: hypothetical protein EOQ69_20650 [Mesorhizobium sp.]|uniref:hypothetical protein n=1 Tax=Mesorhizobium sp. TaxID=1871066 RepID=UPI000FE42742|nr:hypothetical protein [Mesorhizobium sp.]RWA70218.1 MAG: hypothetical protein EOQ28_21635 [Mesorhizobium sp.]RWB99125.1 MAG: hypothetical protein EOQ57_20540 [Mesorhizobium sp.]RWG80603.1 MAG: hypothetical protein EOQ69_20650 [Mesorhizobium sp.]RWK04636.1 MAG: hypothetical protein EOR42_16470 [Mesorhizobium sp.]RWK22489.1 MAG: hypothetical protein EOR43_17075 [Mesorhizobium sp.]
MLSQRAASKIVYLKLRRGQKRKRGLRRAFSVTFSEDRSVHRRDDEFRAILDASRAPAAEGDDAQTGNRPVSSSSE